jgi:hypothetical protein
MLSIINLSSLKFWRRLWQFLNLSYLYHLLYPYIAADFRHQLDCSACVATVNLHTHIVLCPRCNMPLTTQPIIPIVVTPALGLALIALPGEPGGDPVSMLPAKIGVLPTIQPFDAMNNINAIKPNIGIEFELFSDIEEVLDTADTVQKASSFFST